MALGGLAGGLPCRAFAQTADVPLLSAHLADVTGNGLVNSSDEAIVRNALFTERGYGLRAAPGFDIRADVFGRGIVDEFTLDAVRHAVRTLRDGPTARARRPITVAWHYGWYNHPYRRPGSQTVRFIGGDYASSDPEVESIFNAQKNEFGITVDAVSWIPPDANGSMLENYRRGLFQSNDLSTRHLALLYESTIGLPLGPDDRIDFFDPVVTGRMGQHFARMAEFLIEARDHAGARVFTLDERPVMFIFGSHVWGLADATSAQLHAADAAFDRARDAFRRVYGSPPYVVGEEMFLSANGAFSSDRQHRTANFDAIHIYHHASNLKPTRLSGLSDIVLELSESYVDNQIGILATTYQAVTDIVNRYTGRPILVIPNLAPGFAKPGLPTLLFKRRPYAEFMKRLEQFHTAYHMNGPWAQILGTSVLPAPVYIVGSWNEEFEGHAVFPAEFNDSVGTFEQRGFDLVMAIKEVFGWNHYATRSITG